MMRKQRTRQHFIEDFGMNHIEFHVLTAGCTLQRQYYDYGYDAFINTYRENGEYENGRIEIQLKSTDNLKYSEEKKVVLFDLEQRDLELWLESETLFIFVLYDAVHEKAYWLDLQEYFDRPLACIALTQKFSHSFFFMSYSSRLLGLPELEKHLC